MSGCPASIYRSRQICWPNEPRALAARGESLAAFDGRCIPGGCVAPPSNTAGILGRRALPAGRLARLGATPDFHHGLLARAVTREAGRLAAAGEPPSTGIETVQRGGKPVWSDWARMRKLAPG